MGSFIELNDTLQITTEQGFPKVLDLAKHKKKPFTAADFKGKVFSFSNKPNARIYHTTCPVFLVHNINDKWLYWGRIRMLEQTIHTSIDGKERTTSGKYVITKIYDAAYQELITKNETDPGKSYF